VLLSISFNEINEKDSVLLYRDNQGNQGAVIFEGIFSNVCREKGSLLSFAYKFGWVARLCC
jgi:hypothetical protein